jgi:hypothetical protein
MEAAGAEKNDTHHEEFSTQDAVEEVSELFASWVLDGKTSRTNNIPAGPSGSLNRIHVPFVVVQNPGHFNLDQFGAYDLFQNAGTRKGEKWMIIGPAEYELPCYHWQWEALAFFDHLLYGAANGYANSCRYAIGRTVRYARALLSCIRRSRLRSASSQRQERRDWS